MLLGGYVLGHRGAQHQVWLKDNIDLVQVWIGVKRSPWPVIAGEGSFLNNENHMKLSSTDEGSIISSTVLTCISDDQEVFSTVNFV